MWFSVPSWTVRVVVDQPASAAVVAAPPAGALHLGVEPLQGGVVAAEVGVGGVVGRALDLPGADAVGQRRPGRLAGRPGHLPLRRPAPGPQLVPDGAGPEDRPEAGEQRPLERVRPAQAVAADSAVEL